MIKKLLSLAFTSFACLYTNAQGCSDAGFCSAGSLQNGLYKDMPQHNVVGISAGVASGEKQSWIITPQLEIKTIVNSKSYLEVKLPYQITTGNLGTNMGIGDLISTYTHSIKSKNTKLKAQYTAGIRFGLGNASDGDKGKALPMPYQTSLGTTDLIIGVSANWGKHFVVAAGLQQPVIQYNKNGYSTTVNHDSSETAYFSSRYLKRKGDVLLRIEAKKDWKKTGIHGGPLVIYHLGNDNSILADGTQIVLENSSGFTFNVNIGFYYRTENWTFDFTAAAPVHARENRPEGLTRSAIVIPRISFNL